MEFEDGSARHACPICREELASVWLELLRLERCKRHGFRVERDTLVQLLAGALTRGPLPEPAKKKVSGIDP
jgi:hypothetical protein